MPNLLDGKVRRPTSRPIGMGIRFTNVRDDCVGVVVLDLQRSNQRILGLDLSSI